MPTAKSASRLRQMLRGIFHAEVDIEERVGSWLTFEPSDRLLLGGGAELGLGTYIGDRVYSINEKICVLIKARDLKQYRQFLPRGDLFDQLDRPDFLPYRPSLRIRRASVAAGALCSADAARTIG